MRRIEGVRYASLEYILVNIFLEGESNDMPAIIKINRNIYLIKDLGIKILISINILNLERAIVNLLA